MNRANIIDPLFPECPVRNILARISEKWTLLVLLTLDGRTDGMRFSELSKAIPDVSQRMLTTTLRSLEGDGLITRSVYSEVPVRVEYALTERGKTLIPLINQLVGWSIDNYAAIVRDRQNFTALGRSDNK
jgi:DNA-binding HxlR family transcriptional regulator